MRITLRRVVSTFVAATMVILVVGPRLEAQRGADGDAIVPFRIDVPDSVLTDLKERLARTRYPDEIEGAGWDYGTNLSFMKSLVSYWHDTFDWRSQEKRLNQFQQFKTTVDDVGIYFIHVRSKHAGARPLLMLNGWPGAIDEFSKVIGPLTDPVAFGGRADDAYHVVVPFMPGFAFSDKPRTRGLGPARIAPMWTTLMARLGYARYAVHGTDWGASVATFMALRNPTSISALHLATCIGAVPAPPTPSGNRPLPTSSNAGYMEIHSTKPQTLAFSLADSPAGLAAWISEKYHGWVDNNGDVESVYSKDQLLTILTVYWATNTGPSSVRLYYESRTPDGRMLPTFMDGFLPALPAGRVTVPTGCTAFSGRFDRRTTGASPPVRGPVEARYNLVHWYVSERGGHFPAFEQPQLWLDDIRTFLRGRT